MSKNKSWYKMELVNQGGSKRCKMSIHDVIGMWGISAGMFFRELKALGDVDEIDLSLHSPGGEVTEGWALYNGLKNHSAKVNVRIEGLAASMGSVVALAGDTITIPKNAYIMIHRVSAGAYGNADEVASRAKTMALLENDIIELYVSRTGMSEDEVREMVDAETWMNGEMAVELGFADVCVEELQIAAIATDKMKDFKSIPTGLLASLTNETANDESDQDPVDPDDSDEEEEDDPVDPDGDEEDENDDSGEEPDDADDSDEEEEDEPVDPSAENGDEGGLVSFLKSLGFKKPKKGSNVEASVKQYNAMRAELSTLKAKNVALTSRAEKAEGEIREAHEIVATQFGLTAEQADDLPLPVEGADVDDGDDVDAQIQTLRARLEDETDDAERSILAKRLSDLREKKRKGDDK